MTDETHKKTINNLDWISMQEASELCSYSQEYLSLRARQGKLYSKKIGRNWFTTKRALHDYLKQQSILIALPKNGDLYHPILADAPAPVQQPQAILTPTAGPVDPNKPKIIQEFERLNPQIFGYQKQDEKPADINPTPLTVIDRPGQGGNSQLSQNVVEKLDKLSDSLQVFAQQVGKTIPEMRQNQEETFQIVESYSGSWFFRWARFNRVSKNLLKNPIRLVVVVVSALVILFTLVGGFTFGQADAMVERIKQVFKNADTLQGHFPGTHANEVLVLDKAGNVNIYGHIETQGQFRSYAPDGVAPLVVDSMTKVDNLNADYLDNVQAKDFTLAYVTKNGNLTYEDIHLEGKVDVGQTLTVSGATHLLDSLTVDGTLGVFSDAVFSKNVTLSSGDLIIKKGTIKIFNTSLIKNLNAEMLDGLKKAGITLDFVTSNGNSTANSITVGGATINGSASINGTITANGPAFFNSSVWSPVGSFGTLGVKGSTAIGNPNDKSSTTFEVYSNKFTLDSHGNLSTAGDIGATGKASFGGSFQIGGPVLSNLIASGSYNLGSLTHFWNNLYASSGFFTNLSVTGSFTLPGTASSSFVINNDNATADAETSYLAFSRGTVTPSARLTWNSTLKRFEFNEPLNVASGSFQVTAGNAIFNQNASVSSNFEVGGYASVGGNTTIGGNEILTGTLTGNSTASNSLAGSLDITKGLRANAITGTTLKITGSSTFGAGASISGNFDPGADNSFDLGDTANRWQTGYFGTSLISPFAIFTNASVSNNFEIGNVASIGGNEILAGTLTGLSAASNSLAGSLDISKGLRANALTAGGLLTGNSGLTINGTSYFNGRVGIGTAAPATKFEVQGTASASYGLFGALQVAGFSSVSYSRFGIATTNHGLINPSDLLITGSLEVQNSSYFDSLAVNNASVSGNFEVGGYASVGGNFFVAGNQQLTGTFTGLSTGSNSFAGSLNVSKGIHASGNVTSALQLSAPAIKTDTLSNLTGALQINAFTLGGLVTGNGQNIAGLGKLGIGTSNLVNELNVAGTASISGNLLVGGFTQVSGTASSSFAGILELTGTPAGTNVNQGSLYINPKTAGVNNVLLGVAVNGVEQARIENSGNLKIIGTFNSTNTSGTNQLSGNLSVLGNTTLGDASSDTITANGQFASSIIPSADNTYDLGSPTNRWANFHAFNADFTTINTEGTASSSFVINIDNVTADAEDSQLEFERGSVTPNAILKWDSTNKRFDFNQNVYFEGTTIGAGTASSSFAGPVWFTGTPTSSNVQSGTVYVNPGSAAVNTTLLGVAVNGVQKFRVDAEGDTSVSGDLTVTNGITIQGTTGLVLSAVGAPINFSNSGNHDITASGGVLRFGAATLTGLISGNSQSITGLGYLQSSTASVSNNFQVGTTPTLYIDTANNRVGIGQKPTAERLEVAGNLKFTAGGDDTISNDSGSIVITPNTNLYVSAGEVDLGTTTPVGGVRLNVAGGAIRMAYDPGGSATTQVYLNNTHSNDFANQISFQNAGSTKWNLGNDNQANGTQNFYITDAVRPVTPFFIDQSGRIGLGNSTTSPATALELASASAEFRVRSQGSTSDATISLYAGNSDSDKKFAIRSNGAANADRLDILNGSTNLVTIASTGYVGIGTTNPSGPLQVIQTINSIAASPRISGNLDNVNLVIQNTNGSGGTWFFDSAGGVSGYQAGNLAIGTGTTYPNTPILDISPNGNVGINTTNPANNSADALEVWNVSGQDGLIRVVKSGQGNSWIRRSNNSFDFLSVSGTSTKRDINFITATDLATSENIALHVDGSTNNVGINSGGTVDTKFEVGGTASISGNLTFGGNETLTGTFTGNSTGSNSFAGSLNLSKGFAFPSGKITASGNVGIGTTSPDAPLSISGTVVALDFVGAGTARQYLTFNNTGAIGFMGVGGSAAGSIFTNQLAYSTVLGTNNSTAVQLAANGTVALTVDTAQKVGIGTTGPNANLHVSGSVSYQSISLNQILQSGSATQYSGLGFETNAGKLSQVFQFEDSTENLYLYTNTGTSGSPSWQNRLTIQNNGLIGIGTTAPTATYGLTIASASAGIAIKSTTSTASASLAFLPANANSENKFTIRAGGLASTAGERLEFLNGAGTSLMTIASTGNVGIGTTIPAAKLDITANSTNTATNFTGLNLSGAQSVANSGAYLGAVISPSYTAASGNTLTFQAAVYGAPLNSSTGTVSTQIGLEAVPQNVTTGTVSLQAGVYSSPFNSSSGTVSTQAGIESVPVNASTGHITTVYGLYVLPSNASGGTIDTLYGAYIDNPSNSGTITSKYALVTGASAGNVGIGSTSPGTRLDVVGAAGNNDIANFASASGTSALYIKKSGFVGIGTTNPAYQLEVRGSATQSVTVNSTGSGNSANVHFKSLSTGGTAHDWQLGTNASDGKNAFELYDITANASRIYVASASGNVGIGTTSPNALLDVNGAARLRVAASGTRTLNFGVGTTDYAGLKYDDATGNISLNTNVDTTATGLTVSRTSGNVGIGTTGPGAKLHISGGNGTLPSISTSSTQVVIQNNVNSTDSTGLTFISGATGTSNLRFGSATNQANGAISYSVSDGSFNVGPGNFGVNAGGSVNTTFEVGGTASISGNTYFGGNVGIGSTSPGSKLDVNGDLDVHANRIYLSKASNNTGILYGGGDTGQVLLYGASTLSATFGANGITFAPAVTFPGTGIWNASGNVGIGTTNPASDLQILKSTATTLSVKSTANGTTDSSVIQTVNTNSDQAGLYVYPAGNTQTLYGINRARLSEVRLDGNGGAMIDTGTNTTSMYFATGGTTPRMTIDTNGQVFINTTSQIQATTLLQIKVPGSSKNGIAIQDSDDTSNTHMIDFLNASGTIQGKIITNSTTTVNYSVSSDRRLKENIVPTSTGLATLMKIPVNDYDYIADPSHTMQGFIAQDLYNYYPYAVSVGGDDPHRDPWTVDYGRLTPLLVKSIQDLANQQASQSQQFLALQAQVASLSQQFSISNSQFSNPASGSPTVTVSSETSVLDTLAHAVTVTFQNIFASGDIIAQGIKKTYFVATDTLTGFTDDVATAISGWNTRSISIAVNADDAAKALFQGPTAQAADNSKVDLSQDGNYIATYGVDSTRGETQLTGTGTLVNGEARVYFDYSFSSIISATAPIKVIVTPTSVMQGQLYVATKTQYGFVVKELNSQDNGTFDYLVIARRKGFEDATSPSPSPSPDSSGSTVTPSPSTTPTPDESVSPTPTPDVTVTPTPAPSDSPTPTPDSTPAPTDSPTPSP